MKKKVFHVLCLSAMAWLLGTSAVCGATAGPAGPPAQVRIVLENGATLLEGLLAAELSAGLAALYPATTFEVGGAEHSGDGTIHLGTPASAPQLKRHLGKRTLAGPESYVVAGAMIDERPCGLILGADPAGLAHGVYGLLRRLGCGFYLSSDATPEAKNEPFSFEAWDFSDRPLVPTRLVFNWHNFLSGCSTWRLQDWTSWIRQSQKMGYNAVMVHAYGNNPMAGFSFRGQQKPVGYLSSTRIGRDWATNHVNDMRNLHGGEVFQEPVFGCDASIDGTDVERTRAAQDLMQEVFAEAESRAMKVYFAVDIDTPSANPPVLIEALKNNERFQTKGCWLARPDTPGGYAYYRAQVEELLRVYPQIDCLVLWHRIGGTPWMSFKAEEMPRAWQDEYAKLCLNDPKLAPLWHSVHLFGQAKIVTAFQRAAADLGRPDLKIAFGSWSFSFMAAADRFLPPEVELIGLDYEVLHKRSVFDTAERRAQVAAVANHRSVLPVAWAHHDDGNYVGRPYTPYPDFQDKLRDMECDDSGFGIIHWTTRPLDLYFESLVRQVWAESKNEALPETCARMARDLIGSKQGSLLATYLHDWVTTMQKVGRETTNRFSPKPFFEPDQLLAELPEVKQGCQRRMGLLNQIDVQALNEPARQHIRYFKGLEGFILALYENDSFWVHATRAAEAGMLAEARTELAKADPEQALSDFADFSQANGITRGEQGLVVSMNTRWLPYFVQLRQRLRMEAVRYHFGPTSHDPLAQSPGIYTFFFDPDRSLWQTLGQKETGLDPFTLPAGALPADTPEREIFQTGVKSPEPFEINLGPILHWSTDPRAVLPAGDYDLTLWCATPARSGEQIFKVSVSLPTTGQDALPLATDTIRLTSRPGHHGFVKRRLPVTLKQPGVPKLTMEPMQGEAVINGVSLSPR